MIEAELGTQIDGQVESEQHKFAVKLLDTVARLKRLIQRGNPVAQQIQKDLSTKVDDPESMVRALDARVDEIAAISATSLQAEKAEPIVMIPEFSGDVGVERAGRIKHHYDGPEYAWNPLSMIARGIDGAELNIAVLLDPEVSRDYVANVLHDLIIVASLPKPFPSVEEHSKYITKITTFSAELVAAQSPEHAFSPEASIYCDVIGALASYCTNTYLFEIQKVIPEDNGFGERSVHFQPFSLPEVSQDLYLQGIEKTDVTEVIKTLANHLEYPGSPRSEQLKRNVVEGCHEAALVFNQDQISLKSLMQIHKRLMGDEPGGGLVDTNANTLNLFKGKDVEEELMDFETELNDIFKSVSTELSDQEALLLAIDVMKKWTDIHATSDGNGRLSRIIANGILNRSGKPLLPVSITNKWLHRKAIEEASENPEALVDFFTAQQQVGMTTWEQLIAYEASR